MIETSSLILMPTSPQAHYLEVTPEFRIYAASRPNGWHRFWQWFFLGWRWRRLEEGAGVHS